MKTTVSADALNSIIHSQAYNPSNTLGIHEVELDGEKVFSIRAFAPEAASLCVEITEKNTNPIPMQRLHNDGFFELILPKQDSRPSYIYKATGANGQSWSYADPYIFPSILTDEERYLFVEGTYYKMYEKFGAQVMERDGIKGVNFMVWAPNATRVSVIGNFNNWDGRVHQLNVHPNVGAWELFIPGLETGSTYKFEIKTKQNELRIKSDPVGFRGEMRPANASIVHERNNYEWNDTDWIKKRSETLPTDKPISIYEVHIGSWRRKGDANQPLNYRECAHALAEYVLEMGYTHIELLPVQEHPFDGSWGYQVTGYYAPTSRYGTPNDFKYFVDHMHKNGIGVLVDWVPAHFPKDDFSLRFFDGSELYEHADPRLGEHPDWGTLIFNYGRREVKLFLIANALFWFDEYHIDGLRVDAVASMLYLDYSRKEGEWLPNEYGGRENIDAIAFLKDLNEQVYAYNPNVLMIAEESTSWPSVSKPTYLGGLGFGFKWNMGWMNDFVEYMSQDPVHRKYYHNNITFSLWYAFTENFILVLSHDEVVHGKGSLIQKMPGDMWQKFANLRAAYGFMYAHPGKKLLFMGAEFAQFDEWNHAQSLDWHLLEHDSHSQFQQYCKELNRLYTSEPALWQVDSEPKGFQWIELHDSDNSTVSFMRMAADQNDFLIAVCNFTPIPRYNYKLGVPAKGFYREILNSDSALFGGGNIGNFGGVHATVEPYHGFEQAIEIAVPPLAVIYLKIDAGSQKINPGITAK